LAATGVFSASPALAQYPQPAQGFGPRNPPPYSPYLNLLRNNNSFLQNYYGLVRPEIEFRNQLQFQQQQIGYTQSLALATGRQVASTELPVTGNVGRFLDTSGYFLRTGRGRGQAPTVPFQSGAGVGLSGGAYAPSLPLGGVFAPNLPPNVFRP
jgi:hypothetical protein